MNVDWLLKWWNAIYTLPLAFVLVLLTVTALLSLIGGAFGELTQGADHEVEHDVDLNHDVEADADLDHDAELDHETHLGHGHAEPGLFVSALVTLGVGRAPLFMVLQVLLLLWGTIGVLLHRVANVLGPGALLWSLPLTLIASVVGTRSFAGLFSRYFKPFESSSVRRDQIVGRTGRVIYPVTQEEGTIHVRDDYGTLHRVRARSRQGALESGREIIVIGFDPEQKTYQVDDASTFVDRP